MRKMVVPFDLSQGWSAIGLAAFLWSRKSSQYDDMEGSAPRVLADGDVAKWPAAND